jgi:hypothetical protein
MGCLLVNYSNEYEKESSRARGSAEDATCWLLSAGSMNSACKSIDTEQNTSET